MVIDDIRVFNRAVNINNIEKGKAGLVLHLNFEEDKKEGDFYAVGLGGRTYGIIWPDRTVQPEINQIKRSGQPVKIEAVDIENGVLKITNRHHFKNLKELEGFWQITVDGEASQRGFFDCDIPAGETGEVTIDYRRPRIESTTECLLEVAFVLKEDLNWAPKGHEIAWEQFDVPTDFYFVDEEENNQNVTVTEDENYIRISGNDFNYTIDKKTGSFVSLKYKGTEYLEGGPEFMVWRAPIANDIDPWGSYMFATANITPGMGRSIDNQLRTLGMRDLVAEVEEYELFQLKDNEVTLKMDVFANSSLDPAKRKDQWFFYSAFEQKQTWTFSADGNIRLEQEVIPHGPMPEMLQKVGLQFQLPKSFNQVEWYGRGPFENYPDRKTGAKVGLYHSTADSMYVPYIIPQEYGNRSDVRWLKVHNNDDHGLLIEGNEWLNFSLHKYTTDNLSRAMYTYQLEESPNTILNVDYEVSGVGGTAIRQLQKYRVRPDVKKYTITIKLF
jgi:beta-galactosidase